MSLFVTQIFSKVCKFPLSCRRSPVASCMLFQPRRMLLETSRLPRTPRIPSHHLIPSGKRRPLARTGWAIGMAQPALSGNLLSRDTIRIVRFAAFAVSSARRKRRWRSARYARAFCAASALVRSARKSPVECSRTISYILLTSVFAECGMSNFRSHRKAEIRKFTC